MRLVVALAFLTTGAALIIAGKVYDDDGYWGAAALEIGAAMLLVAPLVYVERLLERRIESAEDRTRESVDSVRTELDDVRQEVAQTRRRVDELGGQVVEQLRDEDDALLRRISQLGELISYDDLHGLLHEAADAGYIASSGIRVSVPDSANKIHVGSVLLERPTYGDAHTARNDAVWLTLQDATGRSLSTSLWSPGEDAAAFWTGVVRETQRRGVYEPGLENVAQIVRALTETLHRAVRLRSGIRNRDVGPVEEILPSGWALTTDGLDWAGDDGVPVRVGFETFSRMHPSNVGHESDRIAREAQNWSESQRAGFSAAMKYAVESDDAKIRRAIRGG